MSIHGTGTPISLSEVNVELGKASNANILLNDANVRSLLGLPSGTIRLNSAYGKGARSVINLSVANVNNYNIFANKGTSYVAGKSDIIVTVTGTVGSTAVATPALDTSTAA